jgi:hypothetical protein
MKRLKGIAILKINEINSSKICVNILKRFFKTRGIWAYRKDQKNSSDQQDV